MKVDTDPTTPQTPEQKPADSQPPSEARSSRVTINVRTPSRPLETIPSSPPSATNSALPLVVSVSPDADDADDDDDHDVKISVEETEVEMAHADAAADTAASSSSGASSPPLEVISVDHDDDTDLDGPHPQVTLLQDDEAADIPDDPTVELPFHDAAETYTETITRLAPYMPTRKLPLPSTPSTMAVVHCLLTRASLPDDLVSKNMTDWIQKYLYYARKAGHRMALESYFAHRSLWQTFPDLVIFMINRR